MTQSNLLVIISDEHQARALGCAGHPFVQTPHLDRLAEGGMRFTNAYTPSPICVPARASFATGHYAHQTRCWDNAMPYHGQMRSWGHALQDKGVETTSIGKLHYRNTQDDVGFDHMHAPLMVADGVGMVWASHRDEATRRITDNRMLGAYIGPGQSSYTVYDATVTERTKAWLAEKDPSDGPWCLYVGLVAPHFPLVAPQDFYDLYPHEMLPEVKRHPKDGFANHPWIAKQNAFMDSEAKFKSSEERLAAMAAYYGLCSWLDHNVGEILTSLEAAGLSDGTDVIYSSDHGDNVGARGLWGKSNMYEESVSIPMIMAGPNMPKGTCETPVSLLDITATIVDHFDAELDLGDAFRPLPQIAQDVADESRIVFSEYHAAGAVSGVYMLRKGPWKLIHYVGFEDELFHLGDDPEELVNLAGDAGHSDTLAALHKELRNICDPDAMNDQAFADQAALIEFHGGLEAAMKLGAQGASPVPKS